MAKHGLNKTWDLRPKIGLQMGRTVERERREEEKREEEEEEEKKNRRRREVMIKKVWKLTLIMDSMRFGMDHMVLYDYYLAQT